jgi:hypothetical protein
MLHNLKIKVRKVAVFVEKRRMPGVARDEVAAKRDKLSYLGVKFLY